VRRALVILIALLAVAITPVALADGSAYSTSVGGHSPKSYWKLGESSSAYADSGSDGFSLNASGSGVTAATAGPVGDANAVQLNGGSGTNLSTGYHVELNPNGGYTIEAWIYPTAYPSATQVNANIVASRASDGSTKGYILGLDSNHHAVMCAGTVSGYACENATATIPLNQWSFVVAETKILSSSLEERIWINGSPAGSFSYTTARSINTTGGFYVGNNYAGSKGFTGKIEQVVFNTPALGGATISDDSAIVADYSAMAAAPVNTVAPSISGSAAVGSTLTASPGTWSGSPLIYGYQWKQCDSAGSSCTPISGATASTYTVVSGDSGQTLAVAVTATNAFGTTTSVSGATAMVGPTNLSLPTISGTAMVGNTLTATSGSWSGSPSYAYAWQSCNPDGANCITIAGAASSSYTLTLGDLGSTLKVSVTATASGISATATSNASGVVAQSSGSSIASWNFNETSGAAAADSIGGHDLTFAGGASLGSGYASFGVGDSAGNDDSVFRGLSNASIAGRFRIDDGGDRWRYLFTMRMADFAGNSSWPVALNFYLARGYSGNYSSLGNPFPIPSDYSWGADEYELVAFFGQDFGVGQGYLYAPHVTVTPDAWHTFVVSVNGGQDNVALFFDGQQLPNIYPFGSPTTSGAGGGPMPTGITVGNQMPDGTGYYLGGDFDYLDISGQSVPQNTSPPTISGFAQQGQTLTAVVGSWDPSTYAYQWRRCTTEFPVSCSDISGATLSTYQAVSADVGKALQVTVTATNEAGSTTAASAPTSSVIGIEPHMDAPPRVKGFVVVGETVTVEQGAWSWSSTPGSVTDDVEVCDAPNTGCVDQGEVSSLAIDPAWLGKLVVLNETAQDEWGTVSHTYTYGILESVEQLVTDYRPALFFDSQEGWRPLDVQKLLDEQTITPDAAVHLCARSAQETAQPADECDYRIHASPTLSSLASLTADPAHATDAMPGTADGSWPYLDIPGSADNGVDYQTANPDPTCHADNGFGHDLRECFTQPYDAMYVDVNEDAAGNRYLDYWVFYRYNDVNFEGDSDDHEGDWEGLTVVLSGNTATPSVTGVIYAAHKDLGFVDPSQLQEYVSPDPNDPPSLGLQPFTSHSGPTHVAAFVAEGTHASYSFTCSHSVEFTCANPSFPDLLHWIGENNHDGQVGWALNSACSACVIQMPMDPTSWTFWPGRWGSSIQNDTAAGAMGESPKSPGHQPRFLCTQDGWACTDRPAGLLSLSTAPNIAPPSSCDAWINEQTTAVACDPGVLKSAWSHSTLSRRGKVTIFVGTRVGGSRPGLSQLVGLPLRVGQRVSWKGMPYLHMTITVRAFTKHHVVTLTARLPHKTSGAFVLATTSGRLQLVLR
jgi:hypothetical protein